MLETGPIVGIPAQTSELLHLFLIRLFQALFYLHRNAIFPNNGIVEARLITNTTYLGRGWKELSATFGGLFPGFVRPHWTNKDLSEQFTYGWGGNEAEDLFGFLALFGSSFCALVFGFTNPVNAHGIPYAAFRNLADARVVVDGTGSVSLLA